MEKDVIYSSCSTDKLAYLWQITLQLLLPALRYTAGDRATGPRSFPTLTL